MIRPQTIQIFLPAGDPRGMRVAEITTRIVRVIEVPRSQLADFLKLPEAQQVGVYFLMGELSETGLPRAYIGQSGNVGSRLVQQNQSKDFWNRALVVISLTNSMTQTHALFLEWLAIAEATKAGRYSLENGNAGSQPYTPAPLQADCHEIHETAATLLATLGQPIFEPLTNAPTAKGVTERFYCKGSGADGVGEYTAEGFVVLKGSRGRLENVASIQGTSSERFRQKLLEEGILAVDSSGVVLTRDYLFSSPSMAATALQGRTANGWLEWKDASGRTLDEAKRQVVAAAA
ncbi:GIY-YIG nuclease family protein [Variovorax sp. PAMC 28711]|uniref:GIY-YIG nuclease family protein n=1 Tax=Variovorax sp. PAMC 28711 TaxID=1795631 RepID=UPI00078BDFAD|nr:GIY-YIG nuclease family protein [Variovorax sp. PAMC 28711]AMM23399.1 excinuclease ABC subunit C [Variovorax sp. PAMC 28711]